MTYTPRRNVGYYYDPEVGNFYYAQGHPMKPHRMRMTHNLLLAYGLFDKMDVLTSPRASDREMTRFHADEYINFLKIVTPDNMNEQHANLTRFNVLDDCPVFDGLWEYCQIAAGGSLAGASRLNAGESNTVINWAGGLHHAKRAEASGFCYINDCVLAILELLKNHARVLYVDIDIHHGDGVEEAFYTTDRVMTVSFHKFGEYFPGTGDVTDIGAGRGKNYSVNFPLRDGIDDDSYREIFVPVMQKVMDFYRPGAVVLQCGADSLSGDRLGCFNLSLQGHAQCVDFLQSYNVPLLLLGGGGYTIRNVARCWAFETSRVVGVDLKDELPFNENYEFYGPEFRLHIVTSNMENHNTPSYLNGIKGKIMEQLRQLTHAPSVPFMDVPRTSPLGVHLRDYNSDGEDPDVRKRSRRPKTLVEYEASDDEENDEQYLNTLRSVRRKVRKSSFPRRSAAKPLLGATAVAHVRIDESPQRLSASTSSALRSAALALAPSRTTNENHSPKLPSLRKPSLLIEPSRGRNLQVSDGHFLRHGEVVDSNTSRRPELLDHVPRSSHPSLNQSTKHSRPDRFSRDNDDRRTENRIGRKRMKMEKFERKVDSGSKVHSIQENPSKPQILSPTSSETPQSLHNEDIDTTEHGSTRPRDHNPHDASPAMTGSLRGASPSPEKLVDGDSDMVKEVDRNEKEDFQERERFQSNYDRSELDAIDLERPDSVDASTTDRDGNRVLLSSQEVGTLKAISYNSKRSSPRREGPSFAALGTANVSATALTRAEVSAHKLSLPDGPSAVGVGLSRASTKMISPARPSFDTEKASQKDVSKKIIRETEVANAPSGERQESDVYNNERSNIESLGKRNEQDLKEESFCDNTRGVNARFTEKSYKFVGVQRMSVSGSKSNVKDMIGANLAGDSRGSHFEMKDGGHLTELLSDKQVSEADGTKELKLAVSDRADGTRRHAISQLRGAEGLLNPGSNHGFETELARDHDRKDAKRPQSTSSAAVSPEPVRVESDQLHPGSAQRSSALKSVRSQSGAVGSVESIHGGSDNAKLGLDAQSKKQERSSFQSRRDSDKKTVTDSLVDHRGVDKVIIGGGTSPNAPLHPRSNQSTGGLDRSGKASNGK